MAHNRKLVLGSVALTRAKLPARQTALALGKARDELEQEMIQSGYLDGAPFRWIGLIIRQGLIDEEAPHYYKIDSEDGELPLAIEVNTNSLIGASAEETIAVYSRAVLLALLNVADKYGLSAERMRAMFDEMDNR